MKFISYTFLILLLIGCSSEESPQDLIANRKADAEKKFEQFYACYAIAKETPPIEKDEISWETDDANGEYGSCNVYQISIGNFKDLARPLDIKFDGTRRKEHADMAKMFGIDLSAHQEPHDYQDREKYSWCDPTKDYTSKTIRHFLEAKYLLINRPGGHSGPVMNGEDTFRQGVAHGDVLVFDVLQPKLLGGFTYNAVSDNAVSTGYDVQASLDADLSLDIQTRIKYKFKELTHSIKESFDF